MTVREIVYEWLRAKGYDGLCEPVTGCACKLDDLMPCDGDCQECQAGHSSIADDGFWTIRPGKRPAKEAPHE